MRQALRDEDAGLASERYEALAIASQILDEQVQYYIEVAILAEQNSDLKRSEELFETALVAADLNTELNTKVGLRFAQFLLTHSKPQPVLEQLVKANGLSKSLDFPTSETDLLYRTGL